MPPWIMPPMVIDSGTTIIDGTTIVDGTTTLVDAGPEIAPPVQITPPTAIDQYVDGTIVIFSPETNDFNISYSLNGTAFSMTPGQVHTFTNDRTWTIMYMGSETSGVTQYTLAPGRYKFKRQDGVVGLFATRDVPGAEMVAPPVPPGPAPVPQPPSVLTTPVRIDPKVGVAAVEGKITIFIRPDARFQMVYALNDQPFTMKPGFVQEFVNDRTWNIQFLGSSTGELSNFPLSAGVYEFALGEKGVELWVSDGLPAQ